MIAHLVIGMRDWPRGAGSIDAEAVSRLIAQVAAEEIMPRYAKLAAGDVREKAPGDLVTIADEAAEHRLTPALIQLLPGSVVVGEEAAARRSLRDRSPRRRAIRSGSSIPWTARRISPPPRAISA